MMKLKSNNFHLYIYQNTGSNVFIKNIPKKGNIWRRSKMNSRDVFKDSNKTYQLLKTLIFEFEFSKQFSIILPFWIIIG